MTQQYRPLIPVDPQGLDDIAEGLLNTSPPNVEANDFAPNKNGFIYVPSINLYVAKERSLQGLNWSNTHDELKKQNLSMPTIHQFREFLKYLKSGYQNRKEAEKILDDILTVREPWRAEWLDCYFEKRKSGILTKEFYILTGNKSKAEKLDDYLQEDKLPGINLDEWIDGKNVNKHGLPTKNSQDGKLYYWAPREGGVAGFDAFSDGAYLYCFRYPSNSDSVLGVRLVREATPRKNGGKS